MPWHVSRKYLNTSFSSPPSLDDKIEVFDDRVTGWQIEVAEQMFDKIPDSGYGAISVLFSYFEMIAEYMKGTPSKNASKAYFVDGYRAVFPATPLSGPDIELVYSRVRCGMFHSGFTRPGTQIGSSYPDAVTVEAGYVFVNPHKLVEAIKAHFAGYVGTIRNPANAQARADFEATFDYGAASAPPLPSSWPPGAPPGSWSSGPHGPPPWLGGGGPPPSGSP